MKRFYTLVTTQKMVEGFAICLDGKSVKTPSGRLLSTPCEKLAMGIVQEWAAQMGDIVPDSMPLTQLLNTEMDQVRDNRAAMAGELYKFLDTDLLCYRAGAEPEGMAAAQEAVWNPWLSWFAARFGTALETTTGLFAMKQPQAAHKAVKGGVEGLDAPHFTVLQVVVPLAGSLVLGLAAVERAITAEEIFAAMRVEERFKALIYNETFYGGDPAQEKKDAAILRDLKAAEAYLQFLHA